MQQMTEYERGFNDAANDLSCVLLNIPVVIFQGKKLCNVERIAKEFKILRNRRYENS